MNLGRGFTSLIKLGMGFTYSFAMPNTGHKFSWKSFERFSVMLASPAAHLKFQTTENALNCHKRSLNLENTILPDHKRPQFFMPDLYFIPSNLFNRASDC